MGGLEDEHLGPTKGTRQDLLGAKEGEPMSTDEFAPLTAEELAAEGVTALPDKEVVSILDLAADVDLAIDGAAPIDLAVALNANVVAPIDAAVSANLLSDGSTRAGAGRPGRPGQPDHRRPTPWRPASRTAPSTRATPSPGGAATPTGAVGRERR